MEDLLEKEIKDAGGTVERIHRTGIQFSGSLETAYRLCLWSRIASRILYPVFEFEAEDPDDLYKKALRLPWHEHMDATNSFALDASTKGSQFTDNRYSSLKLKDAIVDFFRNRGGIRPGVDPETPDIKFNLNIRDRMVSIGLDLAGEGLHKRGYRSTTGKAPLKENVAAAILYRAGWPELAKKGKPLVDPMCGSGTLLIEGALMAGDIAPGLFHRHFGFTGWKEHDSNLWTSLKKEADKRREKGAVNIPPIRGFDKDPGVVASAWENIRNAGLQKWIHVEKQEISDLKPTEAMGTPGLIAVNPPYGKRLEENTVLAPLYRTFGTVLKERFPGWNVIVITSSEELSREIGLKPERSNTLFNGPLACVVVRYSLFSRERRKEMTEKERILSPGAEMFANRIRKNLKQRRKWARKNDVTSYRLYDADMPEYSVAIDYYENSWANVQEYAPPPGKVNPEKARQHRKEITDALPGVLGLPPKDIFMKTREKQRGANQYTRLNAREERLVIREGGLKFLVNFTDYLDTGIFLDHRITRNMIRGKSMGRSFLNLFAYTGSATVYAADGGASSTTTVDASSTYLNWAEENLKINNFIGHGHRFIKADCIKWLEECRDSWDLIFLDPPTFSNSKSRKESFDIQSDHIKLLRSTLARLNPGGILIFSNNYRKFRFDTPALSGWAIEEISDQTVPEDFTRKKSIHRCWIIEKGEQNDNS